MTASPASDRVHERAMACLDVLALACQHDHGDLPFEDPRRSWEALELAALRLMELHDWETGVALLADMAANMLRQAVGEADLDRVQEILDHQRRAWSRYREAGR